MKNLYVIIISIPTTLLTKNFESVPMIYLQIFFTLTVGMNAFVFANTFMEDGFFSLCYLKKILFSILLVALSMTILLNRYSLSFAL